MFHAVAHRDKNVVLLQFHIGAIDALGADIEHRSRYVHALSVAKQDHGGIVVLNDLCLLVVDETQNGKRGIRDAARRADRQRRRHGLHAFFQPQAGRQHGGQNFRRQRGENIRLYSTAKPVRQNNDSGVFLLIGNLDMIPAELFSDVVEAHISDIRTEIIRFPHS
ncbi:hypothetical protein SDC9_104082 [bioreactor metagenome]|uniref:Uncharacterized protein n=1 Tax=bioreactor metagenome TaxID=1076179 RepID=A0A645AVS2_9ZZZZ